ncbi:MAG: hypothetical protein AAFO94_18400, partial [Bacteroidota bacterium]
MKQLLCFCFLLTFVKWTTAQQNYWTAGSPYQLNWKKDAWIGGAALLTLGTGAYLITNETTPFFEPGSFTQADIDALNFLDRPVAGRWDLKAKDAGKIFKNTARLGVPLVLVALPGDWKSRVTLATMFVEGTALSMGLMATAKATTDRYRPFTYLSTEQIEALEGEAKEDFWEDIEDDGIEDSFYSGDASATAFGFIFFAKVFNDYYPDSKWRYGVWAVSVTGTVLGAYYR